MKSWERLTDRRRLRRREADGRTGGDCGVGKLTEQNLEEQAGSRLAWWKTQHAVENVSDG